MLSLIFPGAQPNSPHMTVGDGQDVGGAEEMVMLDWGRRHSKLFLNIDSILS